MASSFITLTYNDEHLPENESLDVKDWQIFAKKLRHKMGKFRFFHCGEYGDDYGRPHLHAVLFGLDFSNDRIKLKQSRSKWGGEQHQLYKSETLDSIWGNGHCYIGSFSFESAAYVARYIMKKQTGPTAAGYYQRFSLIHGLYTIKPEYLTMSRNPGLGAKWYKKFGKEVHPSDEVIINGRATRPPTFYDTLLGEQNPRLLDQLKARRITKANKHRKNNTRARLLVRETIHLQRLAQDKRE